MANPILLENGDIWTDNMTFSCGRPITDKLVVRFERDGLLTTDEVVEYHRYALKGKT